MTRASGDGGRRRWPWWVKAVIAVALVAYALGVVWVTGRYALRASTRVVWEESQGETEQLKEFCVLVFPERTDDACAKALVSVNRAVLMTLGEMEAAEVEIFIGGKPVMVDRGCVGYLPTSAPWEALVANLNRELRLWRPNDTAWLNIVATRQDAGAGAWRVKLARSSDDGRDQFTYIATDGGVMPLTWERVSGPGAGISGAGIALLVFAAHCTLATMLLVWWTLRRRGKKNSAIGA